MTSFGFQGRSTQKGDEVVTDTGTFMGLLPNPLLNYQSSALFVKRLTALAISSIIFMRDLLSDSDFADRDLDGVKVKIIKGGRSNSLEARSISKWLEGAFDAIERRYLRMLVFEIIDKESKKVLEMYQVRFSYKGEEIICALENTTDKKKASFSDNESDLTTSVRHLMRTIFLLSSLNGKLPSRCTFSMKLLYYDEVTPPEYEPPGFVSCPEPLLAEMNGSSFRLGSVATPYHMMGISSKTGANKPLHKSQEFLSCKDKFNSEEKSITKPHAGGNIQNQTSIVKCACDRTDSKDPIMLCCKVCGTLQHGGCYKITSKDDNPNAHHICIKCCDQSKSQTGMEEEQCLFRRALGLCRNFPSISQRTLIQEFNLEITDAAKLLKHLQREDAVKKGTIPISASKPEYLYVVNKQIVVKRLIPKYMTANKQDELDELEHTVPRVSS